MQHQHPEDRAAERMTKAFLKKCHKDGRITGKELTEISMDRGGVGCAKPDRLIRYHDFVIRVAAETGFPEDDVLRCLELHLHSTRLTARGVELYLNYPAWSQAELADVFQMPQQQVAKALAAVRRAWPGLRFDSPDEGKYGVPALENMKRIEHYDCSDRLDSDRVEWF